MGNLSVRECVTKVYQAARDGSSDLEKILKRLKTTEQRKTALETKTKDGSHFVTPLIIAAHNGHLNSVKILLGYGAHNDARGTLKIADEVRKGCTPSLAAAASGHLGVVKLFINEGAFVDLQDERWRHCTSLRCERGALRDSQCAFGSWSITTAK